MHNLRFSKGDSVFIAKCSVPSVPAAEHANSTLSWCELLEDSIPHLSDELFVVLESLLLSKARTFSGSRKVLCFSFLNAQVLESQRFDTVTPCHGGQLLEHSIPHLLDELFTGFESLLLSGARTLSGPRKVLRFPFPSAQLLEFHHANSAPSWCRAAWHSIPHLPDELFVVLERSLLSRANALSGHRKVLRFSIPSARLLEFQHARSTPS